MEDQNNENITTNIYTATTTPIYETMTNPYICAGPITTNGDLYRDAVGVGAIADAIYKNGIDFFYTDKYSMIEEKIKALEDRIERIEEALMMECAKNLNSLIE